MLALKTFHDIDEKVWSLTYSGHLMLVSSERKVLEINDNKITEIKNPHTRTIRSIASSQDLIATSSFDSTTVIYQDHEIIATLEGHENEVKSVDFSSDGKLLATCSRDKSVWVWEILEDGEFECVAVLQEHTQDVKSVKWHPSEEILASCSYDDTIRLWKDDDQGDWYCFQVLSNHSSTVWSIDFDSTGDYLVSVSDDLSLRLYKIINKKYEQVSVLENLHSRSIYSCSVKFPFIATGGGDDAICISKIVKDSTNSPTLKLLERIEHAHDSDVNSVCFSEKENLLASGGDDGIVKIWEFIQM